MACRSFVRQAWGTALAKKGHDFRTLSHLDIVNAKPGWLHARLRVSENNRNTWDGMHGGVTATIVDSVGGLGLNTLGYAQTGVSSDIHVSYFRPARFDETIDIYSSVNFSGRSLANVSVDIYGPAGKILARGSHTKYMGKTERVTKFSDDGEVEIDD